MLYWHVKTAIEEAFRKNYQVRFGRGRRTGGAHAQASRAAQRSFPRLHLAHRTVSRAGTVDPLRSYVNYSPRRGEFPPKRADPWGGPVTRLNAGVRLVNSDSLSIACGGLGW